MKTTSKIIIALLGVSVIATSCSRKKDKFMNRNFHAMGTKYNILYNGEIALEQGRDAINDAYTDDYWNLLPVERMEVFEEVIMPGDSKNPSFERAEEKAIKAIQKHGMNIRGKEYNPQIDEAYLLLGQARYYDQRFIPALEAFNYILYKHAASDKINTAKVWREKTNIRLENNELAIKNLKRLLEQTELEDQDLADATSSLAQAYINTKSPDSAITQLQIAAAVTKKNTEQARYNYIIGQLYNSLGEVDSANMAFDKIIDMHRKIPRPYYINAHLEKIKNSNVTDSLKVVEFEEYLADLEKNRENRPFLDKIYYRIGEYHRGKGEDSMAIANYNKSLRINTPDKQLRAFDYSILGDMNFDMALYKNAGAYYDSTLINLEPRTKPYRTIKRKRDNLDDVILYEDIAQTNDSILSLVNMSEAERLAVFSAYIEELKKAEEERAKQEEIANRVNAGLVTTNNPNNPSSRNSLMPPGGNANGQKQTFYFYNPTTVSYGKNEFSKIWGDRMLQDNWRLSSNKVAKVDGAADVALAEGASESELYDPEFYLSKIPTDQKVIDSLIKERNFAYYQLGIIYKEKFDENELAKNKLESLLQSNPEERLILPSKYNLYKIYLALEMNPEAEAMKNDIVANHPDSRYAEILLNPRSELASDENSPENLYKKTYKEFEAENYLETIALCDEYIRELEGDAMVPKFEILKASAKGRLYGFEAYKEGVNYTALTYPNSDEGKRAQELMEKVIPVLANKQFVPNESATNFNLIYSFEASEQEDMEEFAKKLEEAIEKVNYLNLSVSTDMYTLDTKFVVVHGLKSIDGALGLAEILEGKKYKIKREHFAISSPNYGIVQMHKNVNEYLQSQ
ncbi:type IX secretion system periplasmic lipoprotein PorW/SprE [Mangrovimonas xylaniphaga]